MLSPLLSLPLPSLGSSDFESIREYGVVHADKTDCIFELLRKASRLVAASFSGEEKKIVGRVVE